MESLNLTKYLLEAIAPENKLPILKIDSKVIQIFYNILTDAPEVPKEINDPTWIQQAQKRYKDRTTNQLEKFKKVCKNTFDSIDLSKEDTFKRMAMMFDSLLEINEKVLMGELSGFKRLAGFVESFLKTSLDSFMKQKTPAWLLSSKLGENLLGCVPPDMLKTKDKYKVYKKKSKEKQ